MLARKPPRLLASLFLLSVSFALAPAGAHASCLSAVRGMLDHITGRYVAPGDPVQVFSDFLVGAKINYTDRTGTARHFVLQAFDATTGSLEYIDDLGRNVKTTLPLFLAELKDGALTVRGNKKPVNLGVKAVDFGLFNQATAELSSYGISTLTGAEADALLARDFKTTFGAAKCAYDPRSGKLLVGSRAAIEDFARELRRAQGWGAAFTSSDPVLKELALVLARTGEATAPVPAEFDGVIRAASELESGRLKQAEDGVTNWYAARDLDDVNQARLKGLEDAAGKVKPNDPRRPKIALAIASMKAETAGSSTRLREKFPTPVQVPGKLGRLAEHTQSIGPTADIAKAAALAAKYGVEGFHSSDTFDLVRQVFEKLKSGTDPPLRAAEKMAKFGMELDALVEKLPDLGQRAVRYSLAEAVESLEAFKPTDAVRQEIGDVNSHRANYIEFSDYPALVTSYIDQKPPYTTLPAGSILSISDIRDAASHNLWPVLLKPHDMRHVHYAVGHPRASAVYFMAARSQAPYRFAFVSAMYEGVDTVQYSHETALCRYFKNTMHMDLEQAMVYAARVPISELERIAKAADASSGVESYASEIKDWKPKETGEFPPGGKSGNLNTDLDQGIGTIEQFGQDPTHAKYTNYAQSPGSGAATQDDSIHF